MTAQTEGKHAGEFILSEAPGSRSRENVIVLLAENLKAGHVLGRRLDSPTVAAAVALGINTGDGLKTSTTSSRTEPRGRSATISRPISTIVRIASKRSRCCSAQRGPSPVRRPINWRGRRKSNLKLCSKA